MLTRKIMVASWESRNAKQADEERLTPEPAQAKTAHRSNAEDFQAAAGKSRAWGSLPRSHSGGSVVNRVRCERGTVLSPGNSCL